MGSALTRFCCCSPLPQERYRQERQAVLLELRQAKEDAEAERRRILQRIGNTLAHSGWKT
jgi:hypothetical protein